jgi:hypothetical protein
MGLCRGPSPCSSALFQQLQFNPHFHWLSLTESGNFRLDLFCVSGNQHCDYGVDAGKIERCCINAADECWDTRDLLQILTAYHQEVDELFAALVKWSVNAFVSQIQVFAARDNT